jgi:hypothetical protein
MALSYHKEEKYKYVLNEDYVFTMPSYVPPLGREVETKYLWFDGHTTFIMKQGYAWNGPSSPAITTKNFMRGSLIHDALYQMMRLGHLEKNTYRIHADHILYDAIREDGMWIVRALWVYYAVRIGANRPAMRKLKK